MDSFFGMPRIPPDAHGSPNPNAQGLLTLGIMSFMRSADPDFVDSFDQEYHGVE